jgi:hypothetical protein
MPITKDDEIFQGKTLSDLMKDIYENQNKKNNQISILINELKNFIKTTSDAALIVPLIKDYLDVGVRNDEQLVKLAAVFQKLMSSENRNEIVSRTGVDGNGGVILTDEERNDLLLSVAKERELEMAKKEIKSERLLDVDAELEEEMKKIHEEVDKLKLQNNKNETTKGTN